MAKYCEFFDVNETYFPCIDESAINAGVAWIDTYPHKTFVDLLSTVEKMLSGSTKRSVWIHGAYGTGKSKCAYALKKILESPEPEIRAYWNDFEPLKKNNALLEKLVGHRERGIITAYRYASGSITTPQQLFLAVQESIKAALIANNVEYKGENTLKESVIAWMESPAQKNFINELLKKPEWVSTFSQSNVDEIINTLKKSSDVTELMENIFKMASKEGITALSLDADILRSWILDVIEKNKTKIVLIWDEFSGFFRQNKNSLDEFQKIVSICEEAPFYFIVVTHPITSISSNDDSWKIVQQRFDQCEITLPDNIAFDLIASAFKVKPAAESTWNAMTEDLYSSISSARSAVVRAANISNPEVMRNIIPLHPMAALILKNIASGFQSNQRSMFDFIRTADDTDVQAFQWYIKNYGPIDDHPLLTIDMLWDFFYEKGKGYLTSDIKLILDTYQQQTLLSEKEKTVLKAILIMQAIDQRLGGQIAVIKPTEQNLMYAFEGIYELDTECKGIANGLVQKGVLILTPIADGKKVFSAAVLAGDGAKIESFKNDIRKGSTTLKLVGDSQTLPTALSLTPALKLRYATSPDTGAIPVVTQADFIKVMEALKHKEQNWHFYAVLALAKTEDEASSFRNLIKKTISDEAYKHIAVIDALSTPLGMTAFEQYVEYSAMASYYQGNNNQQAKDNTRKAKEILDRDWRDRIHDGQFIVYTYANQDGEKAMGANAVHSILQTIVLNKYNYVFDFTKGLTESQLKLSHGKVAARAGLGGEVKGILTGCDKTLLACVWNTPNYLSIPELQTQPIVIIKKALDAMIARSFDSGKVSIDDIYDFLEEKFGFSPCNISAFLTGFLLREYSGEPYRYLDSEGHPEAMTPDKLAEMIGNYIGKTPKTTYIMKMTPQEKAFYETTEKAWGIEANTCSAPTQAATLIRGKMKELGYPVWCLEEVDTNGVYDIVKKYLLLIQAKESSKVHAIANEIGDIAMQRPTIAEKLKDLLTLDNCKQGMKSYIARFENGKLLSLAKEIGATDFVLNDIKQLFSVEYSALWEGSTGEDEIRKLIVRYEVIKYSNMLLNVSTSNIDAAFNEWRNTLRFIGFSCEAARSKKPVLDKVLYYLFKIATGEELLPDAMKAFLDELKNNIAEVKSLLNNPTELFAEIYAPYLEGFTLEEKEEIKVSISSDMFTATTISSNGAVKKAAEEYRKNQIKSQMFDLWKAKTDTKNPKQWSAKYLTPILACVKPEIYGRAKRAFGILNSSFQSESDIKFVLDFLSDATFIDDLRNEQYRNDCFVKALLGEYYTVLTDLEKVRETLDNMSIEPYEWLDNPMVRSKIKSLADAEYFSGASADAVTLIEKMSDAELKKHLKQLVEKDMELGIKILLGGK